MRNQRIVITVTCDHCPPDQTAEVAEMRTVGYGASKYELDLCTAHADALDKTMTGITGGTRRIVKAPANSKEEKQFRNDVRAWARANGHKVNTRGVIHAETLAAYREHLRQAT